MTPGGHEKAQLGGKETRAKLRELHSVKPGQVGK